MLSVARHHAFFLMKCDVIDPLNYFLAIEHQHPSHDIGEPGQSLVCRRFVKASKQLANPNSGKPY